MLRLFSKCLAGAEVVYFAWALARLSQIGPVKASEEAQAGILRYKGRGAKFGLKICGERPWQRPSGAAS